jgi:hypothetical protein
MVLRCAVVLIGLLALPAVLAYGQEFGANSETPPGIPPGLSPSDLGTGGTAEGTMSAAPGGYEGNSLASQTPDVDPATGPVPFGESYTPAPGPVLTPPASPGGTGEGPGAGAGQGSPGTAGVAP